MSQNNSVDDLWHRYVGTSLGVPSTLEKMRLGATSNFAEMKAFHAGFAAALMEVKSLTHDEDLSDQEVSQIVERLFGECNLYVQDYIDEMMVDYS